MRYGSKVVYQSGNETLTFRMDGDFILTEDPDFSSIEVDISEAQTAGQTGAVRTAQSVRPKSITLTGTIMKNVDINRNLMLRAITPDRAARITYTDDSGSWYLEGATQRTPFISSGIVCQDFQFVFRASYPYWRTTQAGVTDIAGLAALFKFPFYTGGRWYISQYSDSFYKTIVNEGNVPVEFELQLYARSEVRYPEIVRVGTQQRIALNKVFLAGETVVVSTIYGKRGATFIKADGTVQNGFRFLTLDSDLKMALVPGENILRFDAAENREGMRATVLAPAGVLSGV